MTAPTPPVDLGHGFSYTLARAEGIERLGILLHHAHPQADPDGYLNCIALIPFDTPEVAAKFPNKPRWSVVQEQPLTLSPSIGTRMDATEPHEVLCSYHGFIREGKWVPA